MSIEWLRNNIIILNLTADIDEMKKKTKTELIKDMGALLHILDKFIYENGG